MVRRTILRVLQYASSIDALISAKAQYESAMQQAVVVSACYGINFIRIDIAIDHRTALCTVPKRRLAVKGDTWHSAVP